MSKIKVLAVSPDKFGVGKYRIIDPFTYISNNFGDEIDVDIVYDTPFEDNYFKKYDIVVFHSFIHKINHEVNMKRIELLKKEGIKVVMDTDDYWAVDPRHPLFKQTEKNGFTKKRVELFKISDYVSTTTPVYADSLRKKLNINNVAIFANAVNPEETQFQPKPIPSEKIRFGWLGGSSHLADLKLIESGIAIMHDTYKGKVQFVLCGFDLRGFVNEMDAKTGKITKRTIKPTETVWYTYEEIFTKKYRALSEDYKKYLHLFTEISPDKLNNLPNFDNEAYIRRWTRDIQHYGSNYNYIDVSLAPLVDTVFNNNKSQLKAIESGFHKKALIASDVNPYKIDLIDRKNALLVDPNKNHKQWLKHMKYLMSNPNMIEDLGEALYETVKDKYSLANVSKERVEFFKSIVNN